MCRNIQCDGESEKFYKIFWEVNKALDDIDIYSSKSTYYENTFHN